jgi:hypothetical protein
MKQERLHIVPIYLSEAKTFIAKHHRHHIPPVGHIFSVAVADSTGKIRGVATVGRPVARGFDARETLEVNRVATDGCPNACSALYAAAWRTAQNLGYRRLITYILESEPGTSLRAAGWVRSATIKGKSWDTASRARVDKHPTEDKHRYEISSGAETLKADYSMVAPQTLTCCCATLFDAALPPAATPARGEERK